MAGGLLALGIASIPVALIEWGAGWPLQAATAFLFGQLLLGLGILRALNGAWPLQDPRLLFIGVYTLYGIVAALGVLVGADDPPRGLAAATFLYGTGLLGFNAVQAITLTRWQDVPEHAFDRLEVTPVNGLVLVALVGFIFVYAASRGVAFSATIDRRQSTLLNTQLWVVTVLVANGVMMYMAAGWRRLGAAGRLVVAGSIAAFVGLNVTLGNRRDYLFIALFVLAASTTRRRARLGVRSSLFAAAGVSLFLLLGVLRQFLLDPRLALQDPVTIALRTNEFAYPIQTLTYYVSVDTPLRLGATYVTWPSLFVPRILWAGKPDTLGLEFLIDAFGTKEWQGFAFTPVTEAYLNFGWVGPLIVMTLIGVLLVWVVRSAPTHPFRYLLVYSLVVEFNRGETGAVMYAAVMIGSGMLLQRGLARLFAPRPIAGGLTPASPLTGA